MLANTADELLTIFRQEVDDVVSDDGDDSDRLWSSPEVYRYMTQACDKLARTALGLFKVIKLPVVVDEPLVSLPNYVLDIREPSRLVTANREVWQMNANDDSSTTDAYGFTSSLSLFTQKGPVRRFIRDRERKALRLVPIPDASDTLELQCTVTIQVPMQEGMLLPFVEVEDQDLLLVYMKHKAYSKQDAETFDKYKSERFKKEFDERALDRKTELDRQRRAPPFVRVDW